MNPESLLLYTSIAFVAAVTPGPAILLATTHSASFGMKKTFATILGNITGLFTMSLLSVLGLSTLILHSAPVFIAVKLIGAAYLIYLGAKLWLHGFSGKIRQDVPQAEPRQAPKARNLYLQGMLVALSNPKAIAFTTALFPQFIDPAQPLLQQFAVLVVIFMMLSFLCLTTYSYAARKVSQKAVRAGGTGVLSKIFGSAFVLSGLALAGASQK